MTADDSFYQRSTGARQPDDENGTFAGAIGAQRLDVWEAGDYSVDYRTVDGAVIIEVGPLEPIAGGEVAPADRVFAEIRVAPP
jgi:hypothetical protein